MDKKTLKPVRQFVKIKIVSNKKTASGLEIVSDEKKFHQAFIEDYGALAKELIPELEKGVEVNLIGSPQLNIHKEGDIEFAILDSSAINGLYL